MGCKHSKTDRSEERKLLLKNVKHCNRKFKIVLLGSSSVGKTSLVTKYCLGVCSQKYGPTVGGVYYKKDIKMRSGTVMTLNIWDTAGQQKYRSMASLYFYYRDANVIMLVFDLTCRGSFQQLQYWVSQLNHRLQKREVIVMIVGNKADLPHREVTHSQIDNWLDNYIDFSYVQTSASTGKGVADIFELATDIFLQKCLNQQLHQ